MIAKSNDAMKTQRALSLAIAGGIATLLALHAPPAKADPQLSSWLTDYATKYARIYTSDANKNSGTSVTTWTNGTQTQALPAYCGVQQISFSADWVYVKTTGLASHIMGPWYLNAAHTQVFPNYPKNQNVIYRFPRTPTAPGAKTLTGLGSIGFFVDGVAMFDSRDGFYWNGSAESGGGAGSNAWERDAYVNEGVTFDPGNAHQENSGTHHYHANPLALRYLLGDHVDFNAATKTYSESTAPVTTHSPILGYCRDGHPIYGPYGYSSALNAGSGVRRMISGYVLRDGNNGADNLAVTGRTSAPAWVTRLGIASATGPAVSTTYPLGRYMADNAYLGDLGGTQGVNFDLDEYNGRFCVTPEYPGGTYAYFVAITAAGAPTFPYNIGRAFYGSPTGSAQTSITETVTTLFTGAESLQETLTAPAINSATGDVTLTWSSIEGGTYQVAASSDLVNWTDLTPTVSAAANAIQTSTTETGAATSNSRRFYKVTRTALASYDGGGGGGGGGSVTVPATPAPTVTRGSTYTMIINLPNPGTPPVPPANVAVSSVTVGGSSTGISSVAHTSQYVVTCTYAVPAGATVGPATVVVVFPGPNTPTYTFTSALTIN